MAAFSLRGLDEKVAAKLRAQAKRQGVSVNALLQQFTRQGLGLQPTRKRVVYDDLDADDPRAPGLAAYGWLTYLQGELVEALLTELPD